MAGRADVLLGRLSLQAIWDGVEIAMSDELVRNPPDARHFTTLVADLVPRASSQGRLGVAVLAVDLVAVSPDYRQAAEIAIEGSGAEFITKFPNTLCEHGQALDGDALLWWHDLFCRSVRQDVPYGELLVAHGELLLRERRQAVLDYLLVPDRGPGQNNVYAFARAIELLDGCSSLEERWATWIRDGRFEWRHRGDEYAGILGFALTRGLARQPAVYGPLLDVALRRWRRLLTSEDLDDRIRGVRAVQQLVYGGVTFRGRLLDVVDGLDPRKTPLLAEMRDAVLAVSRAEPEDVRPGAGEDLPEVAHFRDLVADRLPAL